ncbi:peptidylprolyl isomerase [Bacillus sp. Marseille-P3661]|uniref:peptidylprolyl isomerase n=1 Tax=Bacillus sp. Marseille-P3661 TaxID=1936234 RepID=UPI000C84E634|nr:peptidylprolyl isomerase [Bacillus sp. Marseille-P3661]
MSLTNIEVFTLNGQSISLQEVIALAKRQGNLSAIEEKIKQLVIVDEAKQRGIEVSVEELQSTADQIRQELNLYSAAETNEWLEKRLLTIEDLQEMALYRKTADKLKESLAKGKVEQFFNENKIAFDTAVISHIVTKEEGEAKEIAYQIEEGEEFHQLARELSIDEKTKPVGGYIGEVYRKALSPQVEAAVFGAQAGEVVGPVSTDQGYHVIKVESIQNAILNEKLTEGIKELLFNQWLSDTLAAASVELKLQNNS